MNFILQAILISIPLFIILKLFKFIRRDPIVVKKVRGVFDTPPGCYPIIGNTLNFIIDNHEIMKLITDLSAKYNGLFMVWLGNLPYFFISKAEDVDRIFSSTVHINKAPEYEGVLGNWLGLGLLNANGKKWFKRRKMLSPAFHFNILEDFCEIMNEQSDVLVNILKKDCANGRPFDAFPYITRCALDIITETAMGIKIGAQNDKDSEYVKAIYEIGDVIIKRFLRVWLRPEFIWKLSHEGKIEKRCLKVLHSFTDSVIAERKKELLLNKNDKSEVENNDDNVGLKKKKMAFLDLLLNEKELTNLDIREEVDTFMFEGHDTTAANLIFALFLLGTYREHQSKIQEELDEIFGEDRLLKLTQTELSKMKYLECCIKESLRIYPSVPLIARHLYEDLTLNDGRVIPANTSIILSIYTLHRDEKVFPNAEFFDPQRFQPENIVKRNAYAYTPFSAGPRNCIGQKFAQMEEKVVLSKILVNFNVEAVQEKENLRLVPDVILRPLDGIILKLTPR